MTKVVHQIQPWEQVIIRCWRHDPEYKGEETDNKNTSDILAAIKELKKDEATKMSIAERLIKLDRMNAVEVLDNQGNGPVVYKDWP